MVQNSEIWLISIAYVILSSLSGIVIARSLPWQGSLAETRLPAYAGIALAPFLVAILAVAMLALPFEKSRLFFVVTPLCVLVLPLLFGFRKLLDAFPKTEPALLGTYLLRFFVAIWIAILIFNSTVYILTQNDALEYAMVGRLLFETGSLSSYPAILPEANSDGFYGPWTHPPLYVSIIALGNYIQGHADTPGLMRFIAPWFLVSTTFLTMALGSLINARVGALAGILILSTPLLFLGADSALIDALTVASFTLLACGLFALNFSKVWAAVGLGALMGLGMWVHSQTILYLPVGLAVLFFLVDQPRSFTHYLKLCVIVVGVALAISAAPYLRNLSIFGALISDDPAVFALETLDWEGYFTFARGIDHTVAIIQYGLFKGWFSLEAYGLTYWFMTVGLAWLIFGHERISIGQVLNPRSLPSNAQQLLWIGAVLVLCYFGGTLISIILGMNLMIKNERYLLNTLPVVALLGAYGLERAGVWLTTLLRSKRATFRESVLAALFVAEVFAIGSFLVIGLYYRYRFLPDEGTTAIDWEASDASLQFRRPSFLGKELDRDGQFASFPSLESVRFMNEALPDGSVVLAARPADFYYLKHRMVSYLDVRLLPVYEEDGLADVHRALTDMGITHVSVVDYYLPPFYNSLLGDLVADPSYSALIYDNNFFQVYELRPEPVAAQMSEVFDFSPEKVDWASKTQFVLGGRKALTKVGGQYDLLPESGLSDGGISLFHRDYTTFLLPTRLNSTGARIPLFIDIDVSKEYLLEISLEGRGFVRIWTEPFGNGNTALSDREGKDGIRLYETVLSDVVSEQTIKRRFLPSGRVETMLFSVEHKGLSSVQIKSARLLKWDP